MALGLGLLLVLAVLCVGSATPSARVAPAAAATIGAAAAATMGAPTAATVGAAAVVTLLLSSGAIVDAQVKTSIAVGEGGERVRANVFKRRCQLGFFSCRLTLVFKKKMKRECRRIPRALPPLLPMMLTPRTAYGLTYTRVESEP